ncbi:C78 family peptidase [Aspergillus tanneri]|uniref:UFSP1/2/DUB catalytic domain-containing protein n=2 Tax=Aspergillus tanneri TaxID=1220188 RepID=A0A5M9MDV4_9EURO|nr:uncharacterized protein ATNIH1004_009925 [Aspergillus tanneri]KAA8643163.1 hypothetical protein ATNIH1004_009925 [Aspergillus tanneri]
MTYKGSTQRAELGPYAHEKQMPSWLREMLEKSTKVTQPSRISSRGRLRKPETAANETADIIPTLARLCSMDKSVRRALLCSPKVCQISKLPREGSFCGYRNIQMMISYIKEAGIPGNDRFPDSLPTILELQNMIEQAWDMGYNSVGREETGGIRGTRKYIGTSEAQALFRSLGIQCETCSIGETQEVRAYDALLASIASYFRQEFSPDKNDKVLVTSLPPIYFQHQGHSLTIIGFEIRDNGSANLLVLDPMFKPPPVVEHGKETYSKFHDPTQTLKGYRRGTDYLRKYKLFEILNQLEHVDLRYVECSVFGNNKML